MRDHGLARGTSGPDDVVPVSVQVLRAQPGLCHLLGSDLPAVEVIPPVGLQAGRAAGSRAGSLGLNAPFTRIMFCAPRQIMACTRLNV